MVTSFFDRRQFLRGSGVALALPLLDAFSPRPARAGEAELPRRMVCLCTSLGLHGPFLFPKGTGRDYELTPYLSLLSEHREDFTLISGLSHPDQSGNSGHASTATWLTSAKHPGLAGFQNTISIDQLAAERFGYVTRFPSLVLGTSGVSQSYTRTGVMIPAQSRPSQVFGQLFLSGTKREVAEQVERLREGRSVLDAVREASHRLSRRLDSGDRARLEEYQSSVRDVEHRLVQAEQWASRPKPKVDVDPPRDITNKADLVGRMRLLCELIPLAIQTDSTRLITVLVQGRNDVPPVRGVSIDHHNLSHHGQDPDKIAQLRLIEEAQLRVLNDLLGRLKTKSEAHSTLLDRTLVLFGSNLGNANAHDTDNLPILLAGGGFRHGQHVAAGQANANIPLANLYVQMLHDLGIEVDSFGSSHSESITGLSA